MKYYLALGVAITTRIAPYSIKRRCIIINGCYKGLKYILDNCYYLQRICSIDSQKEKNPCWYIHRSL